MAANDDGSIRDHNRPSLWLIVGFIVQILLAIVAWFGVRTLDGVNEELRAVKVEYAQLREAVANDRITNRNTFVWREDYSRELGEIKAGITRILDKLEGKVDRTAIGPGVYRDSTQPRQPWPANPPRPSDWRDGREVNR